MTPPTSLFCPACGTAASGKFCSTCGASLTPRACAHCRAQLSPQARFCHRCGQPASPGTRRAASSDRTAWLIAGALCVLLVGGIAYKVTRSAPPAVPDMANTGAGTPDGSVGRAPDISTISPRDRFDRLFNRIMQAAQRGDSTEVQRFTPMALGAYQQLDSVDIDARYHAAVVHLGVGDIAPALALADTILRESPGHLFAYLIRGTAARFQNNPTAQARAERDFLSHYGTEMAAKRVEYLEHKPALEQFKTEAEAQK